MEKLAKMGVFAVVADAKNDDAKSFYGNYGFTELQDSKLTLFLPISTNRLFKEYSAEYSSIILNVN